MLTVCSFRIEPYCTCEDDEIKHRDTQDRESCQARREETKAAVVVVLSGAVLCFSLSPGVLWNMELHNGVLDVH